MNKNVATSTLPADWLSTHTQGNGNDIDQELLLHYTFKSAFKGNILCPFNGSTEKCLDIGYSSGVWMMEMSSEFPRCTFFGIDPKPISPDLVYPANCLFDQGDFLKSLPYEDNTFDVVHLRMVLFSLSAEQREFLLNEVIRVIKPSGFIEFLEPDLSTSHLGPLLNKLLSIWTETECSTAIDDEQFYIKSLSKRGLSNSTNEKVAIPIGKWGNMVGEFSLAALKFFISNTDNIISELNLHDEEELEKFIYSIEEECEQFKPRIEVFSGYAQKL